jgi:hypothetical protein
MMADDIFDTTLLIANRQLFINGKTGVIGLRFMG